ncbi:hypothetical protein QKU48_gp0468 [Fadolivirus algeromassiliense]|jgi:hypothetical protein|uniref:Uncharacterized protein n=1 Tax=Fadolivirus FV1/VV64 TaxID=3070911 RepID=A0A7D3QVM5_9VIRU|nr:hypothetical protein QKU48_gp0468 [Fadolivirus algeromassiliense]QKF93926.1 hypothetical protein Fadolivirus_1_468 [Fadolivirus FV1/VV64]
MAQIQAQPSLDYVKSYGFNPRMPAYKAPLRSLAVAILDGVDGIREGPFRDEFMKQGGVQLLKFVHKYCDVMYDNDVDDVRTTDYETADFVFHLPRQLKGRVRGANSRLEDASIVTLVACFIAQLRQRIWSLQHPRTAGVYLVTLRGELEELMKLIPVQAEKTITVRARPRKDDAEEDGDVDQDGDDEVADIDDADLETAADAETAASHAAPSTDDKREWRDIKILYEPFVEQLANAFSQAKKVQAIESTKARAAKAAEAKASGKSDDKPRKKYIPRKEADDDDHHPTPQPQAARQKKERPPKEKRTDDDGWTTVGKK